MKSLRLTDVSEMYAEQGGGVRTYVRTKLALAAAHDVALSVIVPADEDGIEHVSGGTIVRVKSPKMPLDPRYHLFTNEHALHEAIDRTDPDVIEASSPFGGGHFVARYPGTVPRALVMHQDASLAIGHALFDRIVPRDRLDRWARPYFAMLAQLSGWFDTTIVSGEWLADRFEGFGVPRVRAIPFGIDKSPFARARFDASLRAHLLTRCQVPQDARLLVAVSRHHPEKRLGTILDAFELASKRGERSMGLVVFGDGPLAPLVRARAALIPGVCIAGYTHDRDELARTLASADLFVHGSAAETYGIVLGEAIASGLPFVAPSFGGAVDLARPEYATLYEPGDARACAEAILEMLGRDKAEVARAIDDARDNVVLDVWSHFASLFSAYRGLERAYAARHACSAPVTVGSPIERETLDWGLAPRSAA
jgi:alpha-1,6-mannosyltransferase